MVYTHSTSHSTAHTTPHHTTPHYTTLHYTTLHYTTPHHITSDCGSSFVYGNEHWSSVVSPPLPSPLPLPGPFKNYPQVTVYHPNNGNGHAFANVGWTGWLGSITGISSYQMAISEIGVSFPDSTFGKESRFGTPFTVSGSLQCTDDGETLMCACSPLVDWIPPLSPLPSSPLPSPPLSCSTS